MNERGIPEGVSLEPLASFGVEVRGLDLDDTLSEEHQRWLNGLFATRRLLLFRHPHLSLEAQVRVVGYFGPVSHAQPGRVESYVSNARADAAPALQEGPLTFHSDYAFTTAPVAVISLYAEDVRDGATTTHFADGVRAARHVSETDRARLSTCLARHLYDPDDVAGANADRLRQGDSAWPTDAETALHPVFIRHPRSMDEVLYVNHAQTIRLEGAAGETAGSTSDAVLRRLFDHLYDTTNRYEHRWRTGDLLIWDNIGLQHARGNVDRSTPRTLRRLTIAGTSLSPSSESDGRLSPA